MSDVQATSQQPQALPEERAKITFSEHFVAAYNGVKARAHLEQTQGAQPLPSIFNAAIAARDVCAAVATNPAALASPQTYTSLSQTFNQAQEMCQNNLWFFKGAYSCFKNLISRFGKAYQIDALKHRIYHGSDPIDRLNATKEYLDAAFGITKFTDGSAQPQIGHDSYARILAALDEIFINISTNPEDQKIRNIAYNLGQALTIGFMQKNATALSRGKSMNPSSATKLSDFVNMARGLLGTYKITHDQAPDATKATKATELQESAPSASSTPEQSVAILEAATSAHSPTVNEAPAPESTPEAMKAQKTERSQEDAKAPEAGISSETAATATDRRILESALAEKLIIPERKSILKFAEIFLDIIQENKGSTDSSETKETLKMALKSIEILGATPSQEEQTAVAQKAKDKK